MSRDLGGLGADDGFSLQDIRHELDILDQRLHPRSGEGHAANHRGNNKNSPPGRSGYVIAPQESTIEEEPDITNRPFQDETDEDTDTGKDAHGRGRPSPARAGPRGEPIVLSPSEYKERYLSHVHRLPAHRTWKDYLFFVPKAVYMFVNRLCDAFGFKFIGLLMAVYGLSQGLGENYMSMSSDYYLKDVLKLEPAQAQAFKALTHIPWNIKPIYGLISDTLPIFGYHRGPYIVIAGGLGALAWLTLAGLKRPDFSVSALLMLLANYSIASPDVIIDAAVTERSQQAPIYASDLQSLSWSSHAMGGIIGCSTVGYAQAHLHSRGVFALNSLTAISILVLALLKWLPEKQVPLSERKKAFQQACHKGGQRSLYFLAFFVAVCAVFLATVVNHINDKMIGGYVTVGVAIIVTTAVYMVLVRISPKIAKPAIYFFLREAVQPNIAEAMFYWYTSAPGGPGFTPQFLGILNCISSVSMIIGISLYNRYMSSWKYRTIFIASQFLMVGAGMLDYVLVERLNLKIGLSDKAFVLGDEALIPLLRRFAAIPFFVLAAKVCPEKCEATLFALLMALSNFGGDVGSYMGVGLLKAFAVSRNDYSNLPTVVLIKTFCRFIPVIMIPFLIPDASPSDEILTESEKHMNIGGDNNGNGGGGGDESGQEGEVEMGGVLVGGGNEEENAGSPARRRHRGSSGGGGSGGGGDGSIGNSGGLFLGGVGGESLDLDRLRSAGERGNANLS